MDKKPVISAIAAMGKNRQIGRNNKLLWSIPEDMKRLKALTIGHPIIMGRKTWESIPDNRRPLPQRTNIVVTHDREYEAPGALVVHSLEEALAEAKKIDDEEIFIFGGASIYEKALLLTDRIYLTLVDSEEEGDTFFPPYEHLFTKEVSRDEGKYEGLKLVWLQLEKGS